MLLDAAHNPAGAAALLYLAADSAAPRPLVRLPCATKTSRECLPAPACGQPSRRDARVEPPLGGSGHAGARSGRVARRVADPIDRRSPTPSLSRGAPSRRIVVEPDHLPARDVIKLMDGS